MHDPVVHIVAMVAAHHGARNATHNCSRRPGDHSPRAGPYGRAGHWPGRCGAGKAEGSDQKGGKGYSAHVSLQAMHLPNLLLSKTVPCQI